MAISLDNEARALLQLLVDVLDEADPNDPQTFITYTGAHKRLGLKVLFGHPGRSLQSQGLNSLAEWAKSQSLPAITGLIVRDLQRDPGPGYFKFYGKREVEDLNWWIGEIKKAKKFDWTPYLGTSTGSKKTLPKQNAPTGVSVPVTMATLAQPDSRFFLKSEYGSVSADWPVVAFSTKTVGAKLQSEFRMDSDFIVYTGTGGPATGDPAHRGRLLSVVRIDTGTMHSTEGLIADHSWEWARTNYPGQWEYCFRALEAWEIIGFPRSGEIVPSSYSRMGLYPNRGGVLEITGTDRNALLKLRVSRVELTNRTSAENTGDAEKSTDEQDLFEESRRIANLIFARVAVSGTVVEHTAPERTAPEDLVLNIRELLRAKPLICYLCGGKMQIRPQNRLLQPSPDRVDSRIGDYGPQNLKLAHLACNLGKNAASVEEYQQWLQLLRDN